MNEPLEAGTIVFAGGRQFHRILMPRGPAKVMVWVEPGSGSFANWEFIRRLTPKPVGIRIDDPDAVMRLYADLDEAHAEVQRLSERVLELEGIE